MRHRLGNGGIVSRSLTDRNCDNGSRGEQQREQAVVLLRCHMLRRSLGLEQSELLGEGVDLPEIGPHIVVSASLVNGQLKVA